MSSKRSGISIAMGNATTAVKSRPPTPRISNDDNVVCRRDGSCSSSPANHLTPLTYKSPGHCNGDLGICEGISKRRLYFTEACLPLEKARAKTFTPGLEAPVTVIVTDKALPASRATVASKRATPLATGSTRVVTGDGDGRLLASGDRTHYTYGLGARRRA